MIDKDDTGSIKDNNSNNNIVTMVIRPMTKIEE